MRSIRPGRVNSTRTIVLWVSRAVAAALMAVGAYLFLKKLLFAVGLGAGGFQHMFRIYDGVGEEQSTYRGLALLAVGGAMAIFSKPLARWIVAAPFDGCPGCGYTGAVDDRCPECGATGMLGGSDQEQA